MTTPDRGVHGEDLESELHRTPPPNDPPERGLPPEDSHLAPSEAPVLPGETPSAGQDSTGPRETAKRGMGAPVILAVIVAVVVIAGALLLALALGVGR
ncbi:MAG: hypothetical protein ACTHMZ_00610 [Actinomycetes bacterium]